MSNKKREKTQSKKQTEQKQGFLAALLGQPTKSKASGLSFTLASVISLLLSGLFLYVLYFFGATKTEDYAQQNWYLYCAYLLPQISTVIVLVLYFLYTKKPVSRALSEQKCEWKYFLIAAFMQVGLLSLSELNTLFLQFLGKFGYQDAGITLPSMDGVGMVGVLFVVAVLPAVLEELLFRGMLLNGLKQFGEGIAILACGGLFALYHQNPAQTLYQFCCGAAFALVAICSGSVLPTVLSHLLNNAAILILAKCGIYTLQGGVYAIILVVSIICLLGSLVYLLVFDKKKAEKTEETDAETLRAECKNFWIYAALGIIVCAINWISVLVMGL